ncbi:MAG: hypothetical protein ACXIU8_08280 [Alkalilacustris sp.]
MTDHAWVLVMALWGDAYGAADVNRLVRAARAHSPGMSGAVLLTDRVRDGLDRDVRQTPFPDDFGQPANFSHGYTAKLAVFAPEVAPAGMRCVYLDLDTVVLGDLGRIAACVDGPETMVMLPPASLLGFGPLRRWLFRVTNGRRMATGNSSVMAWHADAREGVAQRWRMVQARGPTAQEAAQMGIDDVFISWAAQARLRGVPRRLAAPFRRAFLSRLPLWWPKRGGRNAGLVAVTFNGTACKPAALAALADGATVRDGRGRQGRWTDAAMGPLRAAVIAGWAADAPARLDAGGGFLDNRLRDG